VDTVYNDSVAAGTHEVSWDGTDKDGREAPSGVYFARAEAAGMTVTEKVSLVR
jgi:flagellar hook assembly protein FlgD